MLKKLLKYDLFDIYRVLWFFYALCLLFAVICRVLIPLSDISTFLYILSRICNGIFISMMINALVNNIFRVWGRFVVNFYHDEGYLTHTLPVSKTELYVSKTLASILSMIGTFAVILLTVGLTYFTDASSSNLMQGIRLFLTGLAEQFSVSAGWLIVLLAFLLMLQMISLLQAGFTGMILGYRKDSHRMAWSILFGLITYAIMQTVLIAFLFLIAAAGGGNLIRLFLENKTPSPDAVFGLILFSDIGYLAIALLITSLNASLFEKGVNLD